MSAIDFVDQTCSMCLKNFTKPKSVSCGHTFCELCLEDYVVSRGFDSADKFPCPVCRHEILMPPNGVLAFPDYQIACMSDKRDSSQPSRPVPKPRRSIEPKACLERGAPVSVSAVSGTDIEMTPGPDDFEMVEEKEKQSRNQSQRDQEAPPYFPDSPPPPYSSVSDTHPDGSHVLHKACANDTEKGWMVVPNQTTNHNGGSFVSGYPMHHNSAYTGFPENAPHNPHFSVQTSGSLPHQGASQYPPGPRGWNQALFGPSHPAALAPSNPQGDIIYPSPTRHSGQNQGQVANPVSHTSAPIYPSMPTNVSIDTACTENLVLRFGKQGSTARDFIKPIGLAVSREGQYIVSDNGGDQNRFLIFNSSGEITTAFKCGCKVKDIAVTHNNELIAAIHKSGSAVRRFTLAGQLKGEFGKFFTFEEPSGIAELSNRGVVLTGSSGHCIYTLTDQMKLQTKFGRKGNGDGYLNHPGFVTVNSKNNIVVSDKVNSCIQVFSTDGKFKQRFGSDGSNHGQLKMPMGLCVDSADNIIIADSGNFRVEAFSSSGRYLCSIVRDTWQLGENVKPVNVSMTPTGKVTVLLRGTYFAEVRVFSSRHRDIPQDEPNAGYAVSFGSAIPNVANYLRDLAS